MPTGSFEKNSFSWQVQQLQQRIQEWGETINFPGLNKMSLPSWLNSPILQTIAKVAFWTLLGLFLIWAIWQCDFTHNFASSGSITLPSTTLYPLFLRQLILDEIDALEP